MAMKKKGTGVDWKSIDLSYDSRTRSLVAIMTTIADGVETILTDKKVTDLAQISYLIKYFQVRDKLDISELVANGTINVDNSVKNKKGIIVYNSEDKQYYKLFYEPVSDHIFRNGGVVDEKIAVRNLKVNWKAVAAVGFTVVLGAALWTYAYFANKNNKNGRNVTGDNDSNKNRIENQQTEEPDYSLPGVEFKEPEFPEEVKEVPPYVPEEVPAEDYYDVNMPDEVPAEDYYVNDGNQDYVNTIVNDINNLCWANTPCDFLNLVAAKDRDTLAVINNARNNVIRDEASIYFLIDDYARYIFDGSTMFDGITVKGFDSLDPVSKYAVIVSGQTIMQKKCPRDCIYILQDGENDFNKVMEKFDKYFDQVYRVELLGESKTR